MEPLLKVNDNSGITNRATTKDPSSENPSTYLPISEPIADHSSPSKLVPDSKLREKKTGWLTSATQQPFAANLFNKTTDPQIKDYNYLCYKYLVLLLEVFSIIYFFVSVYHFFNYFTPVLVHLLSLTLRGWDIYQLYMVYNAMQRKDLEKMDHAIMLIKWFMITYAILGFGLLHFTKTPIVYLTGYIATAADISGEAAVLSGSIYMMVFAELSLYTLVLCGAGGVRAFLQRMREQKHEYEEANQL